jgi:hypothetical protein
MSLQDGYPRLLLMKTKMQTDFRMRPAPPLARSEQQRAGERLPVVNTPTARHTGTQAPSSFEPSPDFVDPRLRSGFEPACWPRCNGAPAPPRGSPGLHERRCLEFLAAFYRLNVLNKQLQAARKARAPQQRIKALLAGIASASTALEALEDRYAPIGFFGEPVMKGIRYQNIVFVRPALPKLQPKASTLSSHFAIPGLDRIPASELRGPVNIIRFDHGKVDF